MFRFLIALVLVLLSGFVISVAAESVNLSRMSSIFGALVMVVIGCLFLVPAYQIIKSLWS